MNNLEYLNDISKSNRPLAKARKPLAPKTRQLLMFAIIGTVAISIIAILGAVIKANSGQAPASLKRLYFTGNTLQTTVNTYNPNIKSSNLRTINLSLTTAISNSNNRLIAYFNSNSLNASVPPEMVTEISSSFAKINSTLYNAKLNGILDRIYAAQIKLLVSQLLSLLDSNLASASNPQLKSILENYRSSVAIVYDSIENYHG